MHNFIKQKLAWICVLTILVVFPSGCKTSCTPNLNTGKSILIGIVTDVDQQVPVNKVTIQLENTSTKRLYKAGSDIQGRYKFTCEPGYYNMKATKSGYTSYEKKLTIMDGSNQEDFYISKLKEKPCTFEGTIKDKATGKGIPNCSVQIGMNIIRSDEKGYFKLGELMEGEYGIWISAPGYEALNQVVTFTRGLNVGKFELSKLTSSSTQQAPVKKRNQEYAVDPTFLEDYLCDSIRTVQPNRGTRTYHIISQDRYNQYVKFDEGQNKGEMVESSEGVFTNLGKGWEEINQLEMPSNPDDVIKYDIAIILSGFNFVDNDLVITYKGSETVNGYQTKKYSMVSKPTAPPSKKCDLEIWIIDKHERLDINHSITRIKGRTQPEAPDYDIWAEVEINFTKIGGGNKITVPKVK